MEQLGLDNRTKTEQAIEFIQKYEPEEGYMVCFSGGKDSIVLYDLAIKAKVKFYPYYSLMPDPPELIRFIKEHYPDVKILRPKFSFYNGVKDKFPPHRWSRWCCTHIKERPSTKAPHVHRLLGIRAEESSTRAKQGWINKHTKKRINYHPMFDWKEWEIWEYIKMNNLKYCSLYDENFSRLGCVVCPLRGYKEMMKYKNRFPAQFKLFEKQAYKWWERIGHHRQSVRGYSKLFSEFLENWYKGK